MSKELTIIVARSREHGRRADEAAAHVVKSLFHSAGLRSEIITAPADGRHRLAVHDLLDTLNIGGLVIANYHFVSGTKLSLGDDTRAEVKTFVEAAPGLPVFSQRFISPEEMGLGEALEVAPIGVGTQFITLKEKLGV